MSDASIWKPGNDTPQVTAANTQVFQHFTATASQTLFTLTDFTYVISSGALRVTVNGVMQTPGIDFTETSTSSFTLTSAATVGDDVVAWGLTESTTGNLTTADFSTAPTKATPVDADRFGYLDSALSYAVTKFTWANLKTALNALYAAVAGSVSQVFSAASIELGHASDTTISRVSAGLIAVEGNNVAMVGTAQNYTAPQRSAIATDNDGSFDLSAKQNFKCTPSAGFTLTFTNQADGLAGSVLLVNGSNYAVAAHANTKISSTALLRISATGTYRIDYMSDGTNCYCTASEALA